MTEAAAVGMYFHYENDLFKCHNDPHRKNFYKMYTERMNENKTEILV